MVFSSVLFLFLFLPIVLTAYHVIPNAWRNAWLLAISLFFYLWGEVYFGVLMLVSIVLNYSFGLWIAGAENRKTAKTLAWVCVGINLGMLAFFKYSNFTVGNLNAALGWMHLPIIPLPPVHLPIGISFYTFHGLSYTLDVYQGRVQPQRKLSRLALYISLFPQLVAGPIIRYRDVSEQLAQRSVTLDDFAIGVRRFIIGLGKKVLLANTLAVPADAIFSLPPSQWSPAMAWLGIACYTLQIYFDFSGYSDMAIGLGRMFGFTFLENFQWPYIADNVRDFWRRWHISLSSWFRDYLYVPLGGNRVGPMRTRLNLLIVFFLCGLWHGAAWNFVVWGLYHGAFLSIERTPVGERIDTLPRPLRHLYTMAVVIVGWVFFRADSLNDALLYIAAMFGRGAQAEAVYPIGYYLRPDLIAALAIGVVCALPWSEYWPRWRARIAALDGPAALGEYAACAVVFVLCAMMLSAGTHNPFIYFRF